METPELSTKVFVNKCGELSILYYGLYRVVIGLNTYGQWLLQHLI